MSTALAAPAMAASQPGSGVIAAQRPIILSVAKIIFVVLGNLPLLQAAPTRLLPYITLAGEPEPIDPDEPTLWIYLVVAVALVLLGGAFAGLTIALMGQVRGLRDRAGHS